jgi:hypothetical protein
MAQIFPENGFTIHRNPNGPIAVSNIGRTGTVGLVELIAITPAFEPSDGMFDLAMIKGLSIVRPLHKIDDASLILDVSVRGEGQAAHENLDRTVEAIGKIANCWLNPEEYTKTAYSSETDMGTLANDGRIPDLLI